MESCTAFTGGRSFLHEGPFLTGRGRVVHRLRQSVRLGLSNARRRQQQAETLLKTAGSPAAPKWRFGLSARLIVLGILVVLLFFNTQLDWV